MLLIFAYLLLEMGSLVSMFTTVEIDLFSSISCCCLVSPVSFDIMREKETKRLMLEYE